jgi:hypothetical protein
MNKILAVMAGMVSASVGLSASHARSRTYASPDYPRGLTSSRVSVGCLHLLCRLPSPKRRLSILFCPPAFSSLWAPSPRSRARGQRPFTVGGRSASLSLVNIPEPAFRGRTSRVPPT